MPPASLFLLLKGKARAVCGVVAPTSCSVEGCSCFFPSPGTCGVLLRKVNGTAIIQLPSKRQMQVRGGGGRGQYRRNFWNVPYLSGIAPRCFMLASAWS